MKKTTRTTGSRGRKGRSTAVKARGPSGPQASADRPGDAGQNAVMATGQSLVANAPRVISADSVEGTRLRLIEAAGQVFAEHGLKEARVRDICRLAGANIAAINYHFGGKKALYIASMRYWAHRAGGNGAGGTGDGGTGARPTFADDNLTASQRLERFVRFQVNRWLDPDRPKWHRQLMAREMFDPTDVFDQMLTEEIKPLAMELTTIVKMYLGQGAPQEEIWMGAFSVIGQVMQYVHGRPVMDRLVKIDFSPQMLDRVVRHVTDFADAGLTAQATRLATGRKGGR